MKRILLLTAIILLAAINLEAAHIIGGKFSYRKLNNLILELRLELERDCAGGGAPFENSLRVGIYGKSTNSLVRNISLDRMQVIAYPTTTDCHEPQKCKEVGIFYGTFSISGIVQDAEGYYVQWERCCMATNISNLVDPGSTPYSAYMEIGSDVIPNTLDSNFNSPLSTKAFNPVICVNKTFKYQFEYTDPDGDSLAYRMIEPIAGGYTTQFNPGQNSGPAPYDNVMFILGLDAYRFLPSSDTPYLNPTTGELTFKATEVGNYVFGYAIDEFRNGKLIGTVYHQSIINTMLCDNIIIEEPQDQYTTLNSRVVFKTKHANPNAKYQWQVSENNIEFVNIPGASEDSLVLNNVDSSILLNKYRCAIDKNICIDYSLVVSVKLLKTGISLNKINALSFYPNPSNAIVTINTDGYDQFEVYSLDGKLLMISNLQQAVDISTLENGIYLIKAKNNRNQKTAFAKVIKSGD
jgi:Secretion system C-terminal sorting domain